ncbi:putative ribosomal protein L19 [Medicago truncatula]|uniref:50S ribosomal protein L19-2 n=1 Tax=Medicago truncatula TaxID=3880 RepID=B7FKU8_MEDTR|nr:50S ribosomal protein L19, chloroplastic [Medicago truncatula]ACJ85382.1 unknown [Medicago truncatula]AES94334.1 50S ribosomal protein L19-2 [Medicago truncatula]AFK48433.1 unknown [Medicago truncatula]RHN53795.1 putative ribosomal protein L19 [Medicago truncatula]
MASQVLLQALFSPIQCPPSKLCFTSSCTASTFGSRNLPLISTSISRRCSPLIAKPSFVVRADSNSDAVSASDNVDENPEASDNVDEVPETEGEQILDSASEVEESKPPRQTRVKLGDVMGILHKRAIAASDEVRTTPDLRTGDIVEIRLEVPENKRRLSIYKGIVISRQNAGIHTTIRVRRIIAGTGVEIVFPIYSPNIKEIKVVKHRKVRQARLYYLKDKLPRFSTFK